MNIISLFIHVYMLMLIYELFTSESAGVARWIFLALMTTVKYGAEHFLYTRQLVPLLVCTMLVLYSTSLHSKKSGIKLWKCALVSYGTDFVINLAIGSVCGAIAGLFGIQVSDGSFLVLGVARLLIIFFLLKRRDWFEKIGHDWLINIGTIAAIVWIFAEQLVRISYTTDHMQYVLTAVVCAYLAAFFAVLWIVDHYKMEKHRQMYEDDNRRMSRILHRSKEILPMLANCVGSQGGIADEQMRKKLEAVCRDYGKELEGDGMSAEVFETTGIDLLDLLLRAKISECAKQDIELDVFVNTQIAEDMKRMDVTDGEITRLIGDLLRNAIRAVELLTARMILLMIVRDEKQQVQIRIYDSGIPFPVDVLEHFGERGNTTWGTGNGLADMMETLKRVGASVEIQTRMNEQDTFSKGISLCFDGQNQFRITPADEKQAGSEDSFPCKTRGLAE